MYIHIFIIFWKLRSTKRNYVSNNSPIVISLFAILPSPSSSRSNTVHSKLYKFINTHTNKQNYLHIPLHKHAMIRNFG